MATIGNTADNDDPWHGLLDDLRLYDRALTVGEIQEVISTPIDRLVVSQPADGEVIVDNVVDVSYTILGDQSEVDHVRFVLDDGPDVIENDLDGFITFTNVPQGSHTLQVFLVRADLSEISGGSETISFHTIVGTFINEIITTDIDLATNIDFLPNETMLIGELAGRILLLQPGASEVDQTPFLEIANIGTFLGQQGLMDIELDPGFCGQSLLLRIFTRLGTPTGTEYLDLRQIRI